MLLCCRNLCCRSHVTCKWPQAELLLQGPTERRSSTSEASIRYQAACACTVRCAAGASQPEHATEQLYASAVL